MGLKEEKEFRFKTEIGDKVKKDLEPWILDQIDIKTSKLPKVTWKDILKTIEPKHWVFIILSAVAYGKIGSCNVSKLTTLLTKAGEIQSQIQTLDSTSNSKTDPNSVNLPARDSATQSPR